jgi:curved DNA-binding protein CbpA
VVSARAWFQRVACETNRQGLRWRFQPVTNNLPGSANTTRHRNSQALPERDDSGSDQSCSTAAQNVNAGSALLNEVERLLYLARTESYYQLLGVRADSPRSEVKRRFYQLARQFHPDRHMNRPDWTPRLQTLMDSLTVAYRTLSDDEAKKAYDSRPGALQRGKQLPPAQLLPDECLKNAQTCVAVKNYVESILWLRRAIDLEPHSSVFRTMLGRSLAAIPEYRHEAVEQFERAIRLDSFNIVAHFEYARLLEHLRFPLRARSHYVRILELDPRHRPARERLNELDVKSPRSILRASLLTRLTRRRLVRL